MPYHLKDISVDYRDNRTVWIHINGVSVPLELLKSEVEELLREFDMQSEEIDWDNLTPAQLGYVKDLAQNAGWDTNTPLADVIEHAKGCETCIIDLRDLVTDPRR